MTLAEFFKTNSEVAIAFSGGVDSSYLLSMAKRYAKRVKAYYVKSEFQPDFEFQDSCKITKLLEVELSVIPLGALEDTKVQENPANRCYFCKKNIFRKILEEAKKDGFSVILDGTNASDDVNDRPGMKALEELKVMSPLRMCGLGKEEIREQSRKEGLFTWNKPAYACLATRIPESEQITTEKLAAVEKAESYLFSLGFEDFRVRTKEGNAILQLKSKQWKLLEENREKILNELKKYYRSVVLDLEVRG